jgi:hypothetical protein
MSLLHVLILVTVNEFNLFIVVREDGFSGDDFLVVFILGVIAGFEGCLGLFINDGSVGDGGLFLSGSFGGRSLGSGSLGSRGFLSGRSGFVICFLLVLLVVCLLVTTSCGGRNGGIGVGGETDIFKCETVSLENSFATLASESDVLDHASDGLGEGVVLGGGGSVEGFDLILGLLNTSSDLGLIGTLRFGTREERASDLEMDNSIHTL